MGKYFGTDGFRGEAGITLTADHAYKVGRFLGWYYNALRERNGNHEEAEKGTRFKKCETDKKVQHGTPQSMQMQVSLSRSIIRVTLLDSRYFWMVYISPIVRDAKLPSSSKR